MIFLALDSSNAGHLVMRLSTPEGDYDFCGSIRLESGLISETDALLKKAGLEIKDVDAYVIGAGPGSFMGLRLGFAVFRTWAWLYDKDITTVSSLDSMVRSFGGRDYQVVVPCVDAKMQKVFANIQYGNILKDSDIEPEALAELIPKDKKTAVIGYDILKNYISGADFYPDFLMGANAFERDFLLSIPKENFSKKSEDYLKKIVPNYLRLSAAEINQKKEL